MKAKLAAIFSNLFHRVSEFRFWPQLIVLTFVVHLLFLYIFAVDVPFMDEWEFFAPVYQADLFSKEWLFFFHNEHRILFTKLLLWGQHDFLGGINFKGLQLFNFLLYSFLVYSLWVFWRKLSASLGVKASVALPFFVFFAGTAAIENIAWGFQSQFHFFLIFGLWGAMLSASENLFTRIFALLLLACSVYSFSAGVVLVGVFLVGHFVLLLSRWGRATSKKSLGLGFASLLVGGALILFWRQGYPSKPVHLPYVLPFKWDFWQHYITMLSGLWGNSRVNDLVNLLVVALLWGSVRALWRYFYFSEFKKSSEIERVFVLWSLAVFAVLASISVGRAAFGSGQGLTSRYMEIVMMLIPFVIWVIVRVTTTGSEQRSALLGAFWLTCAIGYADNFLYLSAYKKMQKVRVEGRLCLASDPLGDCNMLYPHPIADRIPIARDLSAGFVHGLDELRDRKGGAIGSTKEDER